MKFIFHARRSGKPLPSVSGPAAQRACHTPAIERLEGRRLLSAAYSVATFGPAGATTMPQVINNRGQVAGVVQRPDLTEEAFIYQDGRFTLIPSLSGQGITIAAINSSGQLAGEVNTSYFGYGQGFLYSGGKVTYLGTLPGAGDVAVVGLNDSGEVAGTATTADGSYHAFIYRSGKMTDLGALGQLDSYATGINNAGQVIGNLTLKALDPGSSNNATHAFVYSNGKMTDLGTLGGPDSQARAINDAGTIVGNADLTPFRTVNGKLARLSKSANFGYQVAINASGQIAGDFEPNPNSAEDHLFLYSNGTFHDLGIPGDSTFGAVAMSISDTGTILGTSYSGQEGRFLSYVYRDGVITDLSTMIDPAAVAPGVLKPGEYRGDPTDVVQINGSGQIIAQTSDGRGVLLTPALSGSISGTVFNDADNNGRQNNGEAPLAGVTVYQDVKKTGNFDDGDPFTTTDAAGRYSFTDLAPGPYTIRIVPPTTNWRQVPQVLKLASGQNLANRNFATLPLYSYAVTDLGTLGGATSTANAINDAGQIVGAADLANGHSHAFIYNQTTHKMTDLGTFGGPDSAAVAINASGQVAGNADTKRLADDYGDHVTVAFLYSKGHLTPLDSLSADESSYATAMNDRGQVVGSIASLPSGPYDESFGPAFIYSGGYLTKIYPPAGSVFGDGSADSINNAGLVRGLFYNPGFKGDPGDYQQFTYLNGVVTLVGPDQSFDVPLVVPRPSTPTVGWEYLDARATAFLYEKRQAINLNDTLAPGSSWYLSEAMGINASGEIVGTGINPQGQNHAFLLTPVLGSISGTVFDDLNGNGKQDALEGGLQGCQVYADLQGTGIYAAGDPTAITDAQGHYTISGLAPGGYVIHVVPQSGFRRTTPINFAETVVGAGQSVSGPTFGKVAIGPRSGTPAPFGMIQAENFDLGGQRAGYFNPGNTNRGGLYRPAEGVGISAIPAADGGGYFVGWTQPGEWLNYSVSVAATGNYTLNFRLASAVLGGSFHLNVDGVNVTGKLLVPDTGDWNTYVILSKYNVHLTAGTHVLQLVFDTKGQNGGTGNFDWISIDA